MSLITVKDLSKAKALEAVAGGKLYNIVVDTEVCLLLQYSILDVEMRSCDSGLLSRCIVTEC